jgi:hypothetical protein
MSRILKIAVTASLLLTGACTTSLSTQPVETAAGPVVEGTQYSLPVLQYSITVRRMLTGCATLPDGDLQPEFTTSVEPSAKHVAGEQFVVDPKALAGFMKTSAFEMETYDNGTIKSINASATDHGPEVALGLLDLGLNIAKIAFPVPPPLRLHETKAELKPACPTAALTELDARLVQQRGLTRQVNAKLEELAPYERLAAMGALSDSDEERFRQLQQELAGLRKQLAATDALVKASQARLSYTDAYEWIPSREHSIMVFSFPDASDAGRHARQIEWLGGLFLPVPEGNLPDAEEGSVRGFNVTTGQLIQARLAQKHAASLAVVAVVFPQRIAGTNALEISCPQSEAERGSPPGTRADGGRQPLATRPRAEKCTVGRGSTLPARFAGVVYRMPVQAILRVCEGSVAADCDSRKGGLEVLAETSSLVPQMGRLAILPFSNGFGEDNALAATFRADGSLSKAKYDTKKSVAKSLVDTLNTGAGRVLDFRKERRAQELAELDREITLAKKQKELLEAESSLSAANLAARVQAQSIDSQIAQLEAEQAVEALELSIVRAAAATAPKDD